MSYWVELHCDFRYPGLDASGTTHGCWTLRGDNIGHMVQKTPNTALGAIRQSALENGWRRVSGKRAVSGKWACPFCRIKYSNGEQAPLALKETGPCGAMI